MILDISEGTFFNTRKVCKSYICLNLFLYKATDHIFYGFTGVITHAGCWENTRKVCKSRAECRMVQDSEPIRLLKSSKSLSVSWYTKYRLEFLVMPCILVFRKCYILSKVHIGGSLAAIVETWHNKNTKK